MHSVQPTILGAGLVLLTIPSTLAATCINRTGVNTLDLRTANLKGVYHGICDDMWRGHTSSTVYDEHVKCTGTSSKGTYQFCDMALENIASQCGGVAEGNFEYHWNGNNEYYVCTGFVGGSDGCSSKRSPEPKKKPGKPGDPCKKLRSRGEGKIWDASVEGQDGAVKKATEWAA